MEIETRAGGSIDPEKQPQIVQNIYYTGQVQIVYGTHNQLINNEPKIEKGKEPRLQRIYWIIMIILGVLTLAAMICFKLYGK